MTQKKAQQKLSQYGLNPQHWQIFKKSKDRYKIQNQNSKSLVLEGIWSGRDWARIQLISL